MLSSPGPSVIQAAESGVPMPVVPRSRSADGYIFDTPNLVVLARVHEQAKVERASDDPMSDLIVKKNTPYWTYVKASLIELIRINERNANEPDLTGFSLIVEQRDRDENPLNLKLGHLYVLLLKLSPDMIDHWSRAPAAGPPPYALALPQGGFEIVDGRLRVLRKGGSLDAYDGRTLSELTKEMNEHK
jgi:hypothetical protein